MPKGRSPGEASEWGPSGIMVGCKQGGVWVNAHVTWVGNRGKRMATAVLEFSNVIWRYIFREEKPTVSCDPSIGKKVFRFTRDN